jgi:hypothetical protein
MTNNNTKNVFKNDWFFNNIFLFPVVIFLVLLTIPGVVNAASQKYYVTFNGSGAQNGLNYANSWSWSNFLSSNNWSATDDDHKIDPGDTVFLSGTFNVGPVTSNIPGSGAPGNYITIDGDDGVNAPAIFTPSSVSGSNQTINIGSHDYLEFREISFNGKSKIFINGGTGANHIKIHDCNFTLSQGQYALNIRSSNNWKIYNNSFDGTYEGWGQSDGIRLVVTSSTPVYNIEIYNNTFSDWGHSAFDVWLAHNTGSVHDIYIYNNYAELPTRGYGRFFSIGTVKGYSGRTYNFWIHHNYISGMRAPSQIAHADHIYIHNNIFYNTRNCCKSNEDTGCDTVNPSGFFCAGSGKGTFFATGQHFVMHDAAGTPEYVHIFNNTFYRSSESAIQIRDQYDGINHLYIKNNLILKAAILPQDTDSPPGSTNKTTDHAISTWGGGGLKNIEVDNNLIYDSNNSNTIHWSGTSYTVNNFNSKFSWASDNIVSDPLLADGDNEDFSLSSGSGAIDAGINLGSTYALGWSPETLLPPKPVKSINQNDFGNTWDLGAYIFQSLSKPKPPPGPPNPPPAPPNSIRRKDDTKKEDG